MNRIVLPRRSPPRYRAAFALCVATACTPAPQNTPTPNGPPMPASLAGALIPQQVYYPRLARIDSVDDAGTAWLRTALARHAPSVLLGDTSVAFVTLYVSADGRVVGAASRSKADVGTDTSDTPIPFDPAYRFADSAPARDSARVAAERATFRTDQDTMFASQVPTRSVLGERVVLPREFTYDSIGGTSPDDPFIGADPHAFQRDDAIELKEGMVGPHQVLVHILTLLPGRGGQADFGHRVVLRKAPHAEPAPSR